MASSTSAAFTLPPVPVPHKDFIPFIKSKGAKKELLQPYNDYEARLREGFAQHRDSELLKDLNVNAIPIYGDHDEAIKIEARQVDDKTLNEKYVMPLQAKDRKPSGQPATVGNIQDFKKNFNLFSESSLADLDWSNVVAAGSSVVTSLLPVPGKIGESKKAQREYYHDQLAPSSDVDLFIWGLDEAAALEKIKQIEWSVRNAILEEVTTVRTKNAITIASHYPIRHVQIVLRLYQSVSEILTGFDVDCSCFAYDGKQVYGTPRAIAAFKTQTNTIDLTRRSPSYESRLSKYAHRGFEIYCPELNRSKIDPTIFERSFVRTVGLARLLVLEQLPKPNDREEYLNQRREERGRPSVNNYWNRGNALPGNVKDQDPDDIAEWVYDDEVANYHSFTVPYGPKYHAKKIEKLLYTKDILLNAEWNRNKDRTVDLHRHPCFVGPVKDVIQDCCGDCPQPKSDEEVETAAEEDKIYISGDLQFMKDDPGRQAIGSFNPLSDDDWTDMAYIGNTQELCQHICDGDLDFVRRWCEQNPHSINRRDHTGRTPLHLAAQCSTAGILKCLVEHGARIVARLVDGMTALHLAAARGNCDMVSILLQKSEENENVEADKEEQRRAAKRTKAHPESKQSTEDDNSEDEDSDIDMDVDSSDGDTAMTEGSFVKVDDQKSAEEDALDGEDDAEPDVYSIDVLAWDSPVSALHLAILEGHLETVELLVSTFGADVLLPIKILDAYSRRPRHAIMTLLLAAQLRGSNATTAVKKLLSLGASCAQADFNQVTAFNYLVAKQKIELLKASLEDDGAAARIALNNLVLEDTYYRPRVDSPLTTAIKTGDGDLVGALLSFGAKPTIDLDNFTTAYSHAKENGRSYWWKKDEDVAQIWKENVVQPVFLALENDMPEIALQIIEGGADINILNTDAHQNIIRFEEGNSYKADGESFVEAVERRISEIGVAIESHIDLPEPIILEDDHTYMGSTTGYQRWYLERSVDVAKHVVEEWHKCRASRLKEADEQPGKQEKMDALRKIQKRFISLQEQLSKQDAKTAAELYPELFAKERNKAADNRSGQRPGKAPSQKDGKGTTQKATFEPKVCFRPSNTDRKEEGYLELFEAVWAGDVTQVKRLTLANWGVEQERDPLLVTTQDEKGFTPFAIALYRGHTNLARVILDIADAQFKVQDEQPSRRRYTIAEDESDYTTEDDDDDDALRISSEIIDETFTHENIAALRQSVGSQVSALEMLRRTAEIWCLFDLSEEDAHRKVGSNPPSVSNQLENSKTFFKDSLRTRGYGRHTFGRYTIARHDLDLFRFWLRCCQDASKMRSNSGNASFSGFYRSDFEFALSNSFIEEISEMIRIGGAELPLDAFVKQSGAQDDEKPKYYQGLKISGKRMKNWARERGNHEQSAAETTPPLLQAAYHAGLGAVEWFLSDTPIRLYQEYSLNNASDHRLQKLGKAHGGLDQAISTWLKKRTYLSVHAAVLSKAPETASISILKYLLSVFPAVIDQPSGIAGLTPLALSFFTGREDTARTLIDAGADQTTRDVTSKNLVHLAILYLLKQSNHSLNYIEKFRSLLSLIDSRLLPTLLVERCRDSPGSLTPLAFWLSSINFYSWSNCSIVNDKLVPEILNVMLEFGGEEALTIMDSSGQFPLHQAVKHSYARLVKLMLEFDPALLARENAMGQTPLELAESLYIRDCTKGNPDIRARPYRKLEDRRCEDFIDKDVSADKDNDRDTTRDGIKKTWSICKKYAAKEPRARKLISVHEAREVAKRLADKKKAEKEEDADEEKALETKDEVDGWIEYRPV